MKTLNWIAVSALALSAPVWIASRGEEKDPPRATGRILVLENERTIEGQIDKDGNQYRVRRHAGETVIPADNVLFLCESMEEAYDLLRARANPRDADERLRLARWCQLHNLRDQAMAEITAGLAMRPKSGECQRMLQSLQRSTAIATAPSVPSSRAIAAEEAHPAPAVEVSTESLGMFISRVQPILMNTCASCHVNRAGPFKLTRASEGGLLNRRATQQNLAVVVAFLNRGHWEASPFLTKSVSIHGDAKQAPLKGRQTTAYKILEEWVRNAIAESGPDNTGAKPIAAEAMATAVKPGPSSEFATAESAGMTRPALPTTLPSPAAAIPVQPLDPFDPAIFNQKTKPGRRGVR